jgi:hypothetical protein
MRRIVLAHRGSSSIRNSVARIIQYREDGRQTPVGFRGLPGYSVWYPYICREYDRYGREIGTSMFDRNEQPVRSIRN